MTKAIQLTFALLFAIALGICCPTQARSGTWTFGTPYVVPSPVVSTYFTPSASKAPTLAFNPNPMQWHICPYDPCSPTIDSLSGTFNSYWFGASFLVQNDLTIPGSGGVGYQQIPIYSTSSSDPLYTLNDVSGFYTNTANIPNGAHADPSGSDVLFDVVNVSTQVETDAYEFNTGSQSSSVGTTNPVSGGSPNPVWVVANGNSSSTCFAGNVNNCHGGASSVPQSSNELDPVELLSGNIPHSLRLLGSCVASNYVYPAKGSDSINGPPGDCPPMGEYFWIDVSDNAINNLAIPFVIKVLYHNLHDYGWCVCDSAQAAYNTGANNKPRLQMVSDYTWTARGQPSQWQLAVNEFSSEGVPLSVCGFAPTQCYNLTIPMAPGLTPANFHWLQYSQNH